MRRPLPVRVLLPAALALLSVALTAAGIAYDRHSSYRNIEAATLRRAASLSRIVVPDIERAMLDGRPDRAAGQVERLALEPNISMAVVATADGRILHSTDPALRGQTVEGSRASGARSLMDRARTTMALTMELSAGGTAARVAVPFLEALQPGDPKSTRVAVLYTESDLVAPKRALLDEIEVRSALLGLVALIACALVWAYLRRTFTARLQHLVASVAAVAAGAENRVPDTDGPGELAQIETAMKRLVADLNREHARVRESEEKFARIFESAPVMIGLSELGAEGRFVDINAEALRMTGFAREEVVGRTSGELGWFSSEERARMLARLESDGHVDGLEVVVHRRNGGRLECLLQAGVVTIDGTPRLLMLCQDVTDYKRAQRSHLESERKYRQLLDSAPVPVAIASQGLVHYANQAFATMHGLDDTSALIGEPVEARVAPEARQAFLERSRARLAGGPADERYETVCLRPDGSRFPVVATASVVHLSDGPAVIAFFEDVSLKRDAERRLRKSEARFRAIVENSHDGIIFTDAQGIILYRSPAYDTISGFTNSERLGQSGFEMLHPDDVPAVGGKWAQLLSKPGGLESAEYRIRHKDGSWRWIDTSARNLLDNPNVRAVVLTSRDVTERKRGEAERESLHAQLAQAQKIEAVGRLAGGVAHDFNNMLSVILGFAELALAETDVEHPLHADLLEIQRAAERSGRLTRQLLAFARQQPVTPRMVDLNTAVQDMLTMLRRLIGENISLTWIPGADLPPVLIDPSQIDQILANLCVNAKDAIAGVGTVSIETAYVSLDVDFCGARPAASPGEYACLIVRDSGTGMSSDVLEHVFEPFFTTKGPGKGTGLGLATVYGVVTQNGGFIDVHSEPGHGSRFAIYLPAQRTEVRGAHPPVAEPQAQGARGTILLVEDEHAVLALTQRVLLRLGYTVIPANTPFEALTLAERHAGEIDLLMTDVIMPEMNGRELARALVSRWPNIKCLFTSGYTADAIADHGVLDDGVKLLRKPWSTEVLASKVRAVLRAEPQLS